ncbi:MAG TPA: protein kinase, partial [Tepidisphaeraceae bacterium]|nr:protein kinase [Tepidisphaeraceae bacterium]
MDRTAKATDLFQKALAMPPAGRSAFLDQACAQDPQLRAQVESLLAASYPASIPSDPTATTLVELTRKLDATTAANDLVAMSEGPGTKIGPYKILQLIGEGGFGIVYMAEQQQPIQRTVALKIVKLGMDTRQVIARFEAERQALALMDHPNIAKVFDAGATETGRPYFVMELVQGVPITQYCDDNHLSTHDRLQLFIQVCRAVQHAHQKGIIHRDIKPSNVLVTMNDGVPVPKVIDFGIAKAMHQHLTDKTLVTEYRQLIGTPAYMSPEQAEMNGLDIDTRTDIYSLGVLLYELLTSTTPFDPKQLHGATQDQIQRLIRETEPPRPSTRLHTLTQTVSTIAAHRRTDPRHLCTMLRGELDWIVMKAIEKDRTRRYETAGALAADVQQYLLGEAVLARPPSTFYRIGKFTRRHKVGLSAAVLVLLALILGIIGTSIGMVRAQHARRQAQQAEILANRERDRAMRLLEEVKSTQAQTEAIRRGRLVQTLAQTLLEQEKLAEAVTAVHDTLAYQRQHLGNTHPDTLETAVSYADLLARAGKASDALALRTEQIAFLTQAIADYPNDPRLWMHRGWHHACTGQFIQAAADYARAIELDPTNHWPWYHRACILAQIGDRQRYNDHCQAMLQRFGKSRERPIADRTAKACLLMPTRDSDLRIAGDLIDNALAG